MVAVNPVDYYAVGTALKDSGLKINEALNTLMGTLGSTGSMAGSDEGGKDWGQDYDGAASDQFMTVSIIRNAGLNFGDLVQQAAYNHAVADHRARFGQNSQGPYAVPEPTGPPFYQCVAFPPSSVGDSGAGIQDFIELLDAIDVPVPNGNVDNLGNAANAWDKFAEVASAQSRSLAEKGAKLDGIESPEIQDVRGHLTSMREQCDALAENAKHIAQSARDHADELRKMRDELKQIAMAELKGLLAEAAITAAVTFLTAGLGAALGTAAMAAKIASVANKIRVLIDKLKELLKLKKARAKLKKLSDASKKKLEDLANKNKKSIDDAPKKPDEPTTHPKPEPPKSVKIGAPKEFDPQSVRGMAPDDLRSSIPPNWERAPSKAGDGEVFRDPANPGRQIRIMPGYPAGSRPDPLTCGPYAVISQNGVTTKIPLLGNPTL